MKICLVGSSLARGGAERVLATMANYWAVKGWEVTLITVSTARQFYEVDHRIRHVSLGLYKAPSVESEQSDDGSVAQKAAVERALLAIADPFLHFRQALKLRRAVKECAPSAIISFIDQVNVLTLIATRGMRLPVLVSERIDPRHHHIGRLWRSLRRLLYPRATKVVVQCEEIREALPYVRDDQMVIIPNPVIGGYFGARRKDYSGGSGRLKILAMGRLVPQKGFDLLLRAFAIVSEATRDHFLEIWGQGPLLAELKALASSLGVSGRVHFRGVTRYPLRVLRSGDMFVLSSRYEGFPNVLLEAMSVGIPVISFDCPSGPRAIVRNGIDGLLVPAEDVEALARAIGRLIAEPQTRRRMGLMGVEVVQRFAVERVMSKWEATLASLN